MNYAANSLFGFEGIGGSKPIQEILRKSIGRLSGHMSVHKPTVAVKRHLDANVFPLEFKRTALIHDSRGGVELLWSRRINQEIIALPECGVDRAESQPRRV